MNFYTYFQEEWLSESVRIGASCFRLFDGLDRTRLKQAASDVVKLASENGLIALRIEERTWHELADAKAMAGTVLPSLVEAFCQLPKLAHGLDLDAFPGLHRGVLNAIDYIVRTNGDNSAARNLTLSFLRGQKPAATLLKTQGLDEIRNPLSEKNAEWFLQSMFRLFRACGGNGIVISFVQTAEWTSVDSPLQTIRVEQLAGRLRRWLDWSVQARGCGVQLLGFIEKELLQACMAVYPPIKQRISEMHRPPIEPYRSPLQTVDDKPIWLIDGVESSEISNHDHKENLKMQSRALVDALRMGMVPVKGAGDFTLGSVGLNDWVLGGLGQSSAMFMSGIQTIQVDTVCGEYGSGKSHLLRLVRESMEDQGWITASIELDGQKRSFADPLGMLLSAVQSMNQSLWELFCISTQRNGRDFWSIWKHDDAFRALWHAFSAIQQLKPADRWDWAERLEAVVLGHATWREDELKQWKQFGFGVPLNVVKCCISRQVDQRPADLRRSLEAIAWLCLQSGASGFWIGIDECDQEARMLSSREEELKRALDTLAGIVSARGLIRMTFGMIPPDILLGGIGKGEHYSDRLLSACSAVVQATSNRWYKIPVYGREERLQLAMNIYEHYKCAHHITLPFNPNLAKEFDRLAVKQEGVRMDVIRLFIKWYIRMLDTAFGPPRRRTMQSV